MSLLWDALRKLVRVMAVPQYRRAFLRHRVAAAIEHEHVLSGLELDTVVDIGANRGQFALCARRLYPLAQIYSFEPLRKPSNIWLDTFKGDSRATLFNSAVAAEPGNAVMHVAQWDVSSSLLPIGPGQIENFPFTEESAREIVSTALLNQCLSAATIRGRALLKIDVQGSELSALRGCADLLEQFAYVYVEASFVELYVGQALACDIVDFLRARNFRLACVTNLSYGTARRPIQADFLFARPSGAAPG